jgi:hypothetical protein
VAIREQHRQLLVENKAGSVITRNKEAIGRIGKWVAKLNEFVIDFVR